MLSLWEQIPIYYTNKKIISLQVVQTLVCEFDKDSREVDGTLIRDVTAGSLHPKGRLLVCHRFIDDNCSPIVSISI